MAAGVYAISSRTTGRRYIGGSVNVGDRMLRHKRMLRRGTHHSIHLQHAWDKYGAEDFTFQPLLICERKDVLFYEQGALDTYKPEYNIATDASAPMTGRKHSETAKAKISALHRGRKKSPEHLVKMSKAMKGKQFFLGKTHSPSTKAKMAAAATGRGHTQATKELLRSIVTGRKCAPRSVEYKAKLSAALLGHTLSDETKAKISAKAKGRARNFSARHRRNLSAAIKLMWAKRKAAKQNG